MDDLGIGTDADMHINNNIYTHDDNLYNEHTSDFNQLSESLSMQGTGTLINWVVPSRL